MSVAKSRRVPRQFWRLLLSKFSSETHIIGFKSEKQLSYIAKLIFILLGRFGPPKNNDGWICQWMEWHLTIS